MGGLEKVVRVWAAALTEMGHRVVLITATPSGEPDAFPFAVYRHISRAKQLALMRQSDLIIPFNVSLKALPLVKWAGKPLVISHHTALFYPGGRMRWQQRLKRWVSNHWARQNICCSRYIAGQFHQASVVYSPFEAGIFENRRQQREKNSLVFVGRLVSDKGVDLLIRAFHRLALADPGTSLCIIGGGPDRAMLEQQAHAGAGRERIRFYGNLPATGIVELLNQKELMIVPSRMEPFGTTVLEGLACGCRMIVSNQGGLPEAGNGWVRYFDNEDAGSLANAIRHEIEQPMVHDQQAINQYLQQFSVEETARLFAAELEAVIAGRNTTSG